MEYIKASLMRSDEVSEIKKSATVKSHSLNNAFQHGVTCMAVRDAVCVI